MKITLNQQDREEDYLFFIAKYTNSFINEDKEFATIVETLFQLSNESFILRIDKRLESITPENNQEWIKEYFTEINPALWLLTHGHEQLAALMFPEVSDKVESDCSFDEEDENRYKGETFYSTGETKGETFRGKPPL